MEWINEAAEKYGTNEPILFEEIKSVLPRYSVQRVYQLINKAIKEEKLVRFENGLYYIPSITIFGLSYLDTTKVIYRKYIANKDNIYGYYSGLKLKNGLGLTRQMPNVTEVVTNNEASRVRMIKVGNFKVRLRRARIPINKENAYALTILDLFNMLDTNYYDEYEWDEVIRFINRTNLSLNKILKYSYAYPAKAIKNFIISGVPNEIA